MKRIGAMAAVALIALLIALPLWAWLRLKVMRHGPMCRPPSSLATRWPTAFPCLKGTMIVAMSGDEKIGSAMAMSGGHYELELMQPMDMDSMVTFMIGERMVDYEYTWMSGDRMIMDLSADLSAQDRR